MSRLREEMQLFRVMWVNPEYNNGEMNSDGFNTEEDAQSYADGLKKMFADQEYYVQEYTHYEDNWHGTERDMNFADGWDL